jgi:hypothetical protein
MVKKDQPELMTDCRSAVRKKVHESELWRARFRSGDFFPNRPSLGDNRKLVKN